jgi:UDP-N-acetylglucosamine--N-acetylmuramyl-(pentapeptide) pyrophosphoryl-undecaprenol N-acetylglucosamine transferase
MAQQAEKKILIIAGGTGGHIFPALAVARLFSEQGDKVEWLGSEYGLEQKLVSPLYPIHYISMRGLRRSGLRAKLLLPFQLLKAIYKAYRLIRQVRPQVVLGMGGYVTAPGGIAAWLARVPLIIHEQNAVAGLSNRLLSYFARSVLQAFPGAFSAKLKVATVGNPVRRELLALPVPAKRYADRGEGLNILVLGGSQGASAINKCIVELAKSEAKELKLSLWHQTGEADCEMIQLAYQIVEADIRVDAFIDDVAKAYAWADVVICRAGALTVSELAAAGVPGIFIPYPYAVDNHQLYNARFLEKLGGAVVLEQKLMTVSALKNILEGFIQSRSTLVEMAEKARRLADLQAAEQVVAACVKEST